jgi:hypothetical protein
LTCRHVNHGSCIPPRLPVTGPKRLRGGRWAAASKLRHRTGVHGGLPVHRDRHTRLHPAIFARFMVRKGLTGTGYLSFWDAAALPWGRHAPPWGLAFGRPRRILTASFLTGCFPHGMASRSRRMFGARFELEGPALLDRGRRECRMREAPVAACAAKKHRRQQLQVRRISRHSLRNGFNGFLRALSGDHAWLPPSFVDHPTNLAPASERQDHTTSPSAHPPLVAQINCARRCASIASRSQRP